MNKIRNLGKMKKLIEKLLLKISGFKKLFKKLKNK